MFISYKILKHPSAWVLNNDLVQGQQTFFHPHAQFLSKKILHDQ